jgi:hypothetical protein
MADRLIHVALFCALGLLQSAAFGQINDPTQPPPGYSTSAPAPKVEAPPPEAPLLVTSLFLLGDKPWAVVDGLIVRPGDPLANGQVGKIDANGVWISITGADKASSGMRLLKLLPTVVKSPPSLGMEKK